MTTRKTIMHIVTMFAEEWPDKIHVTTARLDRWHTVLKDKGDDLVKLAAAQWLAESRWAPMVADIRRMTCRLELGDVHDAGHAWHRVTGFIQQNGQGTTEPAKHLSAREIGAVEAAGGFWELRHGELPQALRKRFENAYNASVEHDIEKLMDLPQTRAVKEANAPSLPSPADEKPLLNAAELEEA